MASDPEIPDYNLMHAKWAASYVTIKKAKVLVVGCNTGGDCRNLVELGAREVWGWMWLMRLGGIFHIEKFVTFERQ